MSDTHLRHLAESVKCKSYKELSAQCKGIKPESRKCFRLAVGSLNLSEDEVKLGCQAAVKSAGAEPDQYKVVTAMIWPMRVYIEREMLQEASKVAGLALIQSKGVAPSNSRAYALEALCKHTWVLDSKYRKNILRELFFMIDHVPGWRIARALACVTADFDRAGEQQFVDEQLSKCRNLWIKGRVERTRLQNVSG